MPLNAATKRKKRSREVDSWDENCEHVAAEYVSFLSLSRRLSPQEARAAELERMARELLGKRADHEGGLDRLQDLLVAGLEADRDGQDVHTAMLKARRHREYVSRKRGSNEIPFADLPGDFLDYGSPPSQDGEGSVNALERRVGESGRAMRPFPSLAEVEAQPTPTPGKERISQGRKGTRRIVVSVFRYPELTPLGDAERKIARAKREATRRYFGGHLHGPTEMLPRAYVSSTESERQRLVAALDEYSGRRWPRALCKEVFPLAGSLTRQDLAELSGRSLRSVYYILKESREEVVSSVG